MANTVLTLKDIRDEVLTLMDESASTATTTTTLVNNAINQAHVQRLASQPWTFMRWDQPETVTTVASQRFYSLHQEFWKPEYFFNRTTKQYLFEVPPRSVPGTGALWNTDTGHAREFRFAGRTGIQTQPTSASVITIVSSSSSDDGSAFNITVRGVTTNGVTTETITPDGTVSVAGTTSFTKLLSVTKAAAWTGRLTVTSNSAAVTNLVLFGTEYGRSYPQIELLNLPDAGDVIEYAFFRQPAPLTNDYDIPDIPPPHQRILVWDTLLTVASYNTDIPSAAIQMWRENQHRMEVALEQAFLEGQSLESVPRFVRSSTDDAPGYPRIFA